MKTRLFLCLTALFLCTSLASGQWIQRGQDIDGEAAGDRFSRSVSISANGNRLAIGSIFNNGNGLESGHVRVYDWDGFNWIQLGQDIDGEAPDDWSGYSISINADGSRLAISATGNDDNGDISGHVRVYYWNGLSWNQLGQDIDGETAVDASGWSVSLSSDGTVVAIGAPYNDSNIEEEGHVRVYAYNGAAWNQLGEDIDGEAVGNESGRSVSLSSDGSIVAIGARFNNNNGFYSGHVRIYEYDGAAWNQLGQDIEGEAAEDRSGTSVSLSSDGSIVAIGASHNAGSGIGSGHVRIYEYDSAAWNQLGQDIDGEAIADKSGKSVSLSSNGSIVAIGAPYNDGNGNWSGHVRVYAYNGAAWNQLSQDIDGEAVGDHSGRSVSLNSDGSRVAIGAHRNDNNGDLSGHVRVYQYVPYTKIPDPDFEQTLINQGIDSEGTLDGQVLNSDISSIINLNIAHKNISDLTGIEGFTALEVLNCTNNKISSLNVSNNSNLISLDCSNNRLSRLKLNSSGSLTTLNCSDNRFNGSLDLSGQPSLTNLDTARNTRLFCIGVDDEIAANAGAGIYTAWLSDGVTLYSQNCAEVAMAKGTDDSTIKGPGKDDTREEENKSTAQLKIYPNPARDQLYIALPAERELLNVIIYTMQGEKVATAKTTTIPITHLADGVYFVEVKLSDGESILKKIIVSED